jgi:hypothetical protein
MGYTMTREMALLLLDSEAYEYRVAFMRESDGEFEVVETFSAVNDDAANAAAELLHPGQPWYVLDRDGNNINGGDQA